MSYILILRPLSSWLPWGRVSKPVFLQAGCPSCRPTNNVKALKGKYHIPWTCLPQAQLGVFQLCLWPLIAPGYLGGGLPCLSSAFWCQHPNGTKNLHNLGHFARASLPLPDLWCQPFERTTNWRMAPLWSWHQYSCQSVAEATAKLYLWEWRTLSTSTLNVGTVITLWVDSRCTV